MPFFKQSVPHDILEMQQRNESLQGEIDLIKDECTLYDAKLNKFSELGTINKEIKTLKHDLNHFKKEQTTRLHAEEAPLNRELQNLQTNIAFLDRLKDRINMLIVRFERSGDTTNKSDDGFNVQSPAATSSIFSMFGFGGGKKTAKRRYYRAKREVKTTRRRRQQ